MLASTLLLFFCGCFYFVPSQSLNLSKKLSRRDALLISGVGVAYGKLVGDAAFRLSRRDFRPREHEDRVRSTFNLAIDTAIRSGTVPMNDIPGNFSGTPPYNPVRILEVGIGKACRTVLRGLYDDAIENVVERATKLKPQGRKSRHALALIGIDSEPPDHDAVSRARLTLDETTRKSLYRPTDLPLHLLNEDPKSFTSTFDYIQGDASSLPFPDDVFDAVTCCFTLCSVASQETVLREIHRVLKSKGGAFGWVEHVAVQEEDGAPLLDIQQQMFDPLQQMVADNCHLHRDTSHVVGEVFGITKGNAVMVKQDRFFVRDMWPVSCQASGVIVRA